MNEEETKKKILEYLKKQPLSGRELAQKIGVQQMDLPLRQLEGIGLIKYNDSDDKWYLEEKKWQ
jgi:predicted transcriptional regulator